MKELSIEEKAKRYDEAIKIAMNKPNCFVKDVIEEIFPELAESEDERVRKVLLGHFSRYQKEEFFLNKITMGDIVAWLEKQGESIDKIAQRARTEKQRVLVTESDGVANIEWDTRSIQDVKLLLEYGLDYIKKLEKAR